MSDKVLIAESDAKFNELTASGLVLADFFAEWCGPCRQMIPRLDELAEKLEEIGIDVKIVKVDCDKCVETASKFKIMSIPTFLVMKDGSLVPNAFGEGFHKKVGIVEVSELAEVLTKAANQ